MLRTGDCSFQFFELVGLRVSKLYVFVLNLTDAISLRNITKAYTDILRQYTTIIA